MFQKKTLEHSLQDEPDFLFHSWSQGPFGAMPSVQHFSPSSAVSYPARAFAHPFLALDKSTVTSLLPRDPPQPSLKLSAHLLSTQGSEWSYSSHPSTSQDENSYLRLALKVEWCPCSLRLLAAFSSYLCFLSRLFSKYQAVGHFLWQGMGRQHNVLGRGLGLCQLKDMKPIL